MKSNRRGPRSKRQWRITELGVEASCSRCLMFWPSDAEFFYFQRGKPAAYCKACYVEVRIAAGTTKQTGLGSLRKKATDMKRYA